MFIETMFWALRFDIGSGASVFSLAQWDYSSSYQESGAQCCDCNIPIPGVPRTPSAVVPRWHGDDTAAYDIDPLNRLACCGNFGLGISVIHLLVQVIALHEYRSCHEGN